MRNQEQSDPSEASIREDLFIFSVVKRDKALYAHFAPRLASRLSIVFNAYAFADDIPSLKEYCLSFKDKAFPEYQSLNVRLDLLAKKQAVLHTKELDIASQKHRFWKWRGLSPLLDSFSDLFETVDNDMIYTEEIFGATENERPFILHDLANQALRKIFWDYNTVPQEVENDWKLLYGIATWCGNFQHTTIFDIRDARQRVTALYAKPNSW